MFTILLMLPFIEAWITGDKREHHLLQRPRDVPTRTATMVALMTFYGLLWAAAATTSSRSPSVSASTRSPTSCGSLVFVVPVIAFLITRRWCISLQRSDNDKLLHGYESGIIMRSAEGGYSERHLPLSPGDHLRGTDPVVERQLGHRGVRVVGGDQVEVAHRLPRAQVRPPPVDRRRAAWAEAPLGRSRQRLGRRCRPP